MKTGTKIALAVVGFLGISGYLAYQKSMKLVEVFQNMTMKIVGLSNIKASWTNITFNINVYFHNPTAYDFEISGFGVAKLTRLQLFVKGKYFGEANVNISEISIPSRNELIIYDLPVTVATSQILQNIISLDTLSLNDLSAKAYFDIAGKEIEITT